MGRRVWSDPEVLELTSRFVLAADEVWRLQNDSDPECRFFRKAVRGDEAPSHGTLQGTYVLAPGGQLLARRNSGSPQAIAEILRAALERWDELEDEQRTLADRSRVAAGFRWEDSYPEGGLVLRRTARDLPEDGDSSAEPTGRFNRDAIWFHRDELEGWLPEPLVPGASRQVPEALVHRLSCLALVDNVRGQTIPYHPQDDQGSALHAKVTSIEGELVTLEIHGQTRVDSPGTWSYEEDNNWRPRPEQSWPHGISTRISGRAVFDRSRRAFTDFELIAIGERHGRTIMQARGSADPSPIGFVCELAPATWRVAPTFINVYDVPWVREP